MNRLILAAFAALAAAPAAAVAIVDVQVAGGNEVTFLNAGLGLLETDIALRAFRPTVWTVQADTPGESFAFNGFVDVFTGVTLGLGLKTQVLALEGASIETVGAVTPAFSTLIQSSLIGSQLVLRFSGQGEFLNVGFGSVAGGADFRFAFDPNATEARITLSALAVPEPASWAMLIAGFGLVGLALRCRARGPLNRQRRSMGT